MEATLLSFARDKLLPLLIELHCTLRGVPKKVEEIKQELEQIQVDINVADRMAKDEQDNVTCEGIKANVKQPREVAFRREDVVEEYNMTSEELQQPVDPGCAAVLFCYVAAYYQAYDDSPSNSIRHSRHYKNCSSSTRRHDFRDVVRYIKEDEVVGIEDPINELMGWLKEGRAERSTHCNSSTRRHDFRDVVRYIKEDEVVGIEDPINELMGWLKEGRAERSTHCHCCGRNGCWRVP
ncbi:hypothetical protein RIF29_20614 [Crotalaria pallida]|uniref:Disease resistance N-terminal domain-containing protein n=1 Tax=Crotalaria pallida TaxID=3830 RepID=A0AAN9FA19_CROPI